MISIIIAISLLQACSFFEKKIEYEPFVKALDAGDMKTVMSASDDGYAFVEQRGIYSTYEQKEDGEHRNTIYQTSEGIYNTKDKSLYGNTTQEVTSAVDSKDNKEEVVYRTNIMYKNEKVQSPDSNLDVSYVNLIVDRLKGIGKLKMKPGDDIKKFDQPSTVGYKLTELEFQSIINDTLKIQYDEYGGGSIALHIDSKNGSKQILEVSIVVNYKKRNDEGKLVKYISQIHTSFDSHQGNNQDARQEYIDFKAQYNKKQ
ncbi:MULTISPECIES: DUF3952 domain-containing protein [Bacillus]|uniref:DUF3952 domain-containing protein n=1 Tax=Bacillus TaxID=1386 RepID=UPI000BF7DE13|nr:MULTISPECIES: DUF3952 domain-containing protein [Bacillus]MDF9666056.1 DUF3952 domain-containing protein [Bacillus wiedmannii]MDI6503467.1 DUF3952 domain-containing protein [Bacillus wiedmannii]MDI6513566.1 DUF3952 domain-containing protein [Bacillus wiedmannii]PFZ27794.1 hypothetical protein COL51_09875 [Bacillus wiedmannii]PGC19307.1 hypothetical protein COM08_10215 [Bacillus wiedmannii]